MESHQLIFSVLLFCLFYPSYTSSGRIQHGVVGGQEAKPHSRPYMVYVKIDDSNCGGTLITPEWVLTAAHCYGNIVAILGAHDVKQPEDSQQIIGIKSYHIHPEYNDDDSVPFNDALLLRGDSGGPLVCGGVVEGIVSFGFDHPPGVYARIGKYLNWIKETISKYGDNTD